MHVCFPGKTKAKQEVHSHGTHREFTGGNNLLDISGIGVRKVVKCGLEFR